LPSGVSIVVPVYDEGAAVLPVLDRLFRSVSTNDQVLVVYDRPDDTTVAHLVAFREHQPRLLPFLNTYGPGPANAIRFGLDRVDHDVAVVTMSDGSDDYTQIERLGGMVRGNIVIAAASRYMRGGRQVGGPLLKRSLSRTAGWLLYLLARVGTHDATNSFKAYSVPFVREVGIHSRFGFEVGIELVAKARRLGLGVVEIPTVWRDRTDGTSRFQLITWLPRYLRWFFFAFGRRLRVDELVAKLQGVRS
jgi:dolichol-phosphate mannosyltransferase